MTITFDVPDQFQENKVLDSTDSEQGAEVKYNMAAQKDAQLALIIQILLY